MMNSSAPIVLQIREKIKKTPVSVFMLWYLEFNQLSPYFFEGFGEDGFDGVLGGLFPLPDPDFS